MSQFNARVINLEPGLYLLGVSNPQASDFKLGLYPVPSEVGEVAFAQKGDKASRLFAILQQVDEEVLIKVSKGQMGIMLVDFAQVDGSTNRPIEIKIDRVEPNRKTKKPNVEQLVNGQIEWLPLKGIMVGGTKFSAPNGVVGSPDAVQPIAAFSIDDWSLPAEVALSYVCRKEGLAKSFAANAGSMLGSDQESAIVSVTFAASRQDGCDQELKGHVVFAGSPPLAIVSGKELSGPTGREPLVGLRVALSVTADEQGAPRKSVWDDAVVIKSKNPKPQKGSRV